MALGELTEKLRQREEEALRQSPAADPEQRGSPIESSISPETRSLVERFKTESSLPQEDLERRALSGTEAPRSLLEDVGRDSAGFGGADPMLDQALKRRAHSLYGGAQAELKSQVRTQLPMERTRRLEEKHSLAQAEQQVANKYYQVLYKRHLAEQSARSSVLRSIVGGIATVGGALIAGPAGAAAGGALAGIGTGVAMSESGQGPDMTGMT